MPAKKYIRFEVDRAVTLRLDGEFEEVERDFCGTKFMRYECPAVTDGEGNMLSVGRRTMLSLRDLIGSGHPLDGRYSIVRTGYRMHTQYHVTALDPPRPRRRDGAPGGIPRWLRRLVGAG